MARLVQVVLEDDIDGGAAEETVQFGLDGISYEIDLNERNAEKLRNALERYVEHARRVRGGRGGRRAAAAGAPGKSRASEIRAWAEANGISVSARGRIPADVIAQYEAANG